MEPDAIAFDANGRSLLDLFGLQRAGFRPGGRVTFICWPKLAQMKVTKAKGLEHQLIWPERFG